MVQKKRKKTLAEEIGQENVDSFLEHLYHERSFSEIVKHMPGVFKSKNAVAGVKNRHRKYIEIQLTALRVICGPPTETGKSKPFSGKQRWRGKQKVVATHVPNEDAIVTEALKSWNSKTRFRRASAYAAMHVNRARIEAGIKNMTNADEIEALVALKNKPNKK